MKTSHFLAFAITVGIAGWMSTGTILVAGRALAPGERPERGVIDELFRIAGLGPAPDDSAAGDTADRASLDAPAPATGRPASPLAAQERPFPVRTRTFIAGLRRSALVVSGRTQADVRVSVRAETGGIVKQRPVREGARVEAGDLLCRIDRGARDARLARASAALSKAEFDLAAAERLSARGFAPESRLRAARAAVDAARAALAEARLDLSRTEIRAPVAGIVQKPLVEIGGMLTIGGVCASLVDIDPILMIAQISERDIGALETGMSATVTTVTGETRTGTIRYIAPSADPATRTFRVEIEIENADNTLREGVTAHAEIPLAPVRAHFLSPSILTLDDDGRIGLRGVDDRDRVVFWPVKVVASERTGVWVTGLPERVRLITVGQEYVKAGAIVEPVEETSGTAREARQ